MNSRLLLVTVCACVGTMACGGLGGAKEMEELDPIAARTQGAVALWTFDEGSGSTAYDTGDAPASDLVILDQAAKTKWLSAAEQRGLAILESTRLVPGQELSKVESSCGATGEFSFEMWITPDGINGEGTIASMGRLGEDGGYNFRVRQNQTDVTARVRSTGTDDNGNPYTSSGPDQLEPGQSHVVFSWSPAEAVTYLNGEAVNSVVIGGDFSNWGALEGLPAFTFAVGSDVNGGDPWLGTVHLMAIYCNALSAGEVATNYEAKF